MNRSVKISRITIQLTVVLLLIAGLLYRIPMIQAATPPAPVLLVTNSASTANYGAFIAEILRTEGLNNFDTVDISQMVSATLAQYDLVILAQTTLSGTNAANLRSYVNGGGRLLAMRPDAQIADIFGLGTSVGQQTDGYLSILNAASFDGQIPGIGLPSNTLQIHGASDYRPLLSGAVMLAQLYTDATTGSIYPAVSGNAYGQGRAVAFAFDLASTIILTRQGNPANANVDVDADGVFRTIDLFQKIGGGSPWVDLNKVPIPQADEQQRFFARLVTQLQVKPAPQLWYFPGNQKTMLILTGDAHGNPTSYYQTEINSLNKYGAKMTFYLALAGQPDDANLQAWRAQGHEFGIHPYAYKPDDYLPFNVTSLPQGFDVVSGWFASAYTSQKSQTARDHQLAWLGYTDVADLEAANGISMDTNFYAWGPWLQKADGSWAHGYVNGSGLPMKMVKLDGTITSVYQHATQIIDEQLLIGAGLELEGLEPAQGLVVSKALIDASQAGYYSALLTQNHVDYYVNGGPLIWWEDTMAYAQALGIPMWNADKWLQFTTTRHDANYSNVVWNGTSGNLSFNLMAAAVSGIQLTTMVPMTYAGRTLTSIFVNGTATSFQQMDVNGVNMALVTLPSGNYSFAAQYQQGVLPTNTPTITPTLLPGQPTSTPLPPTATPTPYVVPPTATPTALPSTNSLIHTTVADFGQTCAVNNQTHVSDLGGGAVALTGVFSDDFNGAALNGALWSAGDWGGGSYTPALTNSVVKIHAASGGWVRSIPTYTHGVMEAVAEFGNGAYQHIGFGSDQFTGNRYFIFSTGSGDGHLHARVNNNATEQNIDLGPLPVGPQHYRIEWTNLDSSTDQIAFFMNGVQQTVLSVSNVGASGFYLYLSNALDLPSLNVDAVQVVPTYLSSGTYTSCLLDAGVGNAWNTIFWDRLAPANTNLLVETHQSTDGITWGAWTPATTSSGTLLSAMGQYIQYRLTFTTSDASVSPVVNSVTIHFVLNTAATNTPVPPTATRTPLPPTATNTITPVPPTATNTNTPVPPTATNTNTPVPPTPTNTPIPPTATPTIPPLFPQAVVLDNFNRASGAIGTNWQGSTRTNYQISLNQLMALSTGDIYWRTSFGTRQQVYVGLNTLITSSHEVGLILKSRSSLSYTSGEIEVLYDPNLHKVQVRTYTSTGGWVQSGADIPVTFVNSDQFGASADASGTVNVYKNGSLIATRSVVTWPYYNLGGFIGIKVTTGANTMLDNFGGGNY